MSFAYHGGGKTTGQKHKYNKKGESHCFHCGSEDNWANNFTEINKDQQGKLHAKFKSEEREEEDDGDKIAFIQVSLYQVNGDSNEEYGDDDSE